MSDPKDSDFTPTIDPGAEVAPPEMVSFGVSDLTDSSVETLGSYMLGETDRNYYHPTEPIDRSTPDDPGILGTQSLTDIVTDGSPDGFFAGVQDAAAAYYATITDGSTPDAVGGGTFGPLTDFLDKTSQTDGHHLLGEIVGDAWSGVFDAADNAFETPEPKSSIRSKVSDVLKHNRFSPGGESPYIEDKEYSDGMFSIQKLVGRYNPDADPVAFSELAKIGFSMMLTATGGRDYGEDGADPDSQDSTKAIGAGLGTQLAITRVPSEDMYARAATGFPKGADDLDISVNQDGKKRKGAGTEAYEAKNSKSYGQLNSYLEPFDGPLPVGMIVLAVIAAVAVLIAGIVLAAIITLIFLLFPPGMVEEPPEPLPMGAASGQPDFGKASIGKWLMRMLRMPILRSGKSFLAAMFYGILQFYWRITDAISSGYFIIVSRAAIRDLEQISDSIADADFSNIVGGLESIFIVLDAFATSTTFQFLNTLAALGDIVLMAGGFGSGDMEFSPYTSAAGQPGNLAPAIANLHIKSRTKMGEDPDYRLAWRFGSTPSRYLLPPNILSANAALGFNGAFGAAGRMPKGWGANGARTQKFGGVSPKDLAGPGAKDNIPARQLSGRYTADERQGFEDELNAYYVPFYLHDLRTNEILAMHSFIDSFSDSFAPEWSNVGGFGRMDDVMIYKKTKRTMGLSFWMIATGPEDLDELYFAINKLVTMVYPQWSKGTLKKSDDGTSSFIMPFSQIPTASPIVRLRVGELWSSNYSLTSLSRLFGLGTSGFTGADGKPPYAAGGAETQDQMDGKVLQILEDLEKQHSLAQSGPPPFDEALAANIGVAAGGLVVPGVSKGYGVGAKVIVKPSRYKKAKFDVTKVSFKKTMGKQLVPNCLESDRKGTVKGYVIQPVVSVEDTNGDGKGDTDKTSTRTKEKARIRYAIAFDPGPVFDELNKKDADLVVICGDGDIILDHEEAALNAINNIIGTPAATGGIPNPFADPPEPTLFSADALKDFFGTKEGDVSGNSIARAFHESGGQGIAGAITNLDFDWNLAPWDERPGSRAPTFVKVTMGFSPIHDIPLGLDSQGGIRAPAYNVGGIVRGLFGAGHSLTADANTKALLTEAIKALIPPSPEEEAEPTGTEDPGA